MRAATVINVVHEKGRSKNQNIRVKNVSGGTSGTVLDKIDVNWSETRLHQKV